MTGTDLCVNKSQFVPVIFEPPCTNVSLSAFFSNKLTLCCFLNVRDKISHSQVAKVKITIFTFTGPYILFYVYFNL